MSPLEIAEIIRRRLAAELRGDRAALERLASSIGGLSSSGGEQDETTRTLALAFQMERFYTVVETMIARILRTIDGDVPSGAGWHHEILRAASVEIEGLRPAILPEEVVPLLRELLGFRHYARHGYDITPDPDRIRELAGIVARTHRLLASSLAAFEASLR